MKKILCLILCIFCISLNEISGQNTKAPSFPGGDEAMKRYLSQNVKYPILAEENGVEGDVLCCFTVQPDGKITDASVVKSDHPFLSDEALRVVSSMPKWSPAVYNGKPISVRPIITVKFRLAKPFPQSLENTSSTERNEQYPSFQGGMEALNVYVKENLCYPEEARKNGIHGRVVCKFVVEPDGTITNAEVINSVDSLLDAEALRVVRTMPQWTPGKVKGKPVRTNMTLPLAFNLNGKKNRLTDGNDAPQEADSVEDEIPDGDISMPVFPGGKEKLFSFFRENIQYPEDALKRGVEGKVWCTFNVNADGSVSDVNVTESVDPELDAEAVRLIKAMPKWEPGMMSGKPVRVMYSLPVTFRITRTQKMNKNQ